MFICKISSYDIDLEVRVSVRVRVRVRGFSFYYCNALSLGGQTNVVSWWCTLMKEVYSSCPIFVVNISFQCSFCPLFISSVPRTGM